MKNGFSYSNQSLSLEIVEEEEKHVASQRRMECVRNTFNRHMYVVQIIHRISFFQTTFSANPPAASTTAQGKIKLGKYKYTRKKRESKEKTFDPRVRPSFFFVVFYWLL